MKIKSIKNVHRSKILISIDLIVSVKMSGLLKIPESYKDIITVAIKGIGHDTDTMICTTEKKLMAFFKGCLIKNINVGIKVDHLEPIIVYEPEVIIYYILHGDKKVVIVKEGTNLEIITTYTNVYEIVVNDHKNAGVPQLYMRTDNGFECIDHFDDKESTNQTNHGQLQETSVVYKFVVEKLQKLKIVQDTNLYQISQKVMAFIDAVKQVSIDDTPINKLSSNIVAKNSWLKLSNENLVYGFTLQNTSKLPVTNFNLILLEDNKQIWSRYQFGCWGVKKNNSSFNFFSGYENTGIANNIEKSSLNLSPESSILVTSVINNWSLKSLPYFVNGLVYINNENDGKAQFINTDEIMVTSNLFLDKEFDTFVKNGIFIEDLATLHCSKLLSCYQIKCSICLKDLSNILVNNFKFDSKHELFLHSSLSWLRTIVCFLDPISPLEFKLKVFSESLVYTKTFIQVLLSTLPDHTSILSLDNNKPTCLNIDDIMFDLRELRKLFKEYLNEEMMIPREQWNNTRKKLVNIIVSN